MKGEMGRVGEREMGRVGERVMGRVGERVMGRRGGIKEKVIQGLQIHHLKGADYNFKSSSAKSAPA